MLNYKCGEKYEKSVKSKEKKTHKKIRHRRREGGKECVYVVSVYTQSEKERKKKRLPNQNLQSCSLIDLKFAVPPPTRGSSSFVLTLYGDSERACLHRTITDRLQDQFPFFVPRAKCLEQLDDLVPPTLAHVVDADRAHLDVVVE